MSGRSAAKRCWKPKANEMNRRAESAVAGMAERLQPVLETAGQQTIERLANELEQRLAPQITRATEMLSKLAFDRDQAEKALAEHQHRIWQVSERSVQDSVARSKELLAQVEKEFVESARTTSARWFSELEAKATETTHSTFEALFKSAEWYEKKVQTQMQTTLEKGLDQAASSLREKAGELSGLFASELDHYSRSYVEHAQNQIQENARDAAEKASLQMAEVERNGRREFHRARRTAGARAIRTVSIKNELGVRTERGANGSAHDAGPFEARKRRAGLCRGVPARPFAAHAAKPGAGQARTGIPGRAWPRKACASRRSRSTSSCGLRCSPSARKSMDEYKQRLENASNSWLLTTVTKLNQQSEGLIEQSGRHRPKSG